MLALLTLDPIATHSMRLDNSVRWSLVIQVAFWSACGFALLAALARYIWTNRSADNAMLGLWIAGTFCFAVFVNWNVAARSILPMAPAAAILAARMWTRRIETAAPAARAAAAWQAWTALGAGVGLALVVCAADASLARTQIDAARQISDAIAQNPDRADRKIYFAGHWGFQYYMQRRGAIALDKRRTTLAVGDVVVLPENNTALIGLPPGAARTAAALRLDLMPMVSTMRVQSGAGFYTDVWGPLPFAIGSVPPERYQMVVMNVPLSTQRR
jgi:hypothetical protein